MHFLKKGSQGRENCEVMLQAVRGYSKNHRVSM